MPEAVKSFELKTGEFYWTDINGERHITSLPPFGAKENPILTDDRYSDHIHWLMKIPTVDEINEWKNKEIRLENDVAELEATIQRMFLQLESLALLTEKFVSFIEEPMSQSQTLGELHEEIVIVKEELEIERKRKEALRSGA